VLRLERILGYASDAGIAGPLHALEHGGKVERILLSGDDMLRRRLHVVTDRGTECAVALPRKEKLGNGAVLLLEPERAILVQLERQQWLTLETDDPASALKIAYFAGNMHWPVRFEENRLRIALGGPEQHYLDRLAHLLQDGKVRRVRDA